jgi:hypothetical protein
MKVVPAVSKETVTYANVLSKANELDLAARINLANQLLEDIEFEKNTALLDFLNKFPTAIVNKPTKQFVRFDLVPLNTTTTTPDWATLAQQLIDIGKLLEPVGFMYTHHIAGDINNHAAQVIITPIPTLLQPVLAALEFDSILAVELAELVKF